MPGGVLDLDFDRFAGADAQPPPRARAPITQSPAVDTRERVIAAALAAQRERDHRGGERYLVGRPPAGERLQARDQTGVEPGGAHVVGPQQLAQEAGGGGDAEDRGLPESVLELGQRGRTVWSMGDHLGQHRVVGRVDDGADLDRVVDPRACRPPVAQHAARGR